MDEHVDMYKKVERLQEALSLAVKSLDELNFITQNNAANNILRFPNAEAIPQNDSEFISWIKGITKLRAAREKFFPSTDLFAEPAWDMLLDLSLSAIQRKKVSVTSLCIAARAPNTTALRWVNVLEKMGFIERTQDQTDARRSFLEITDPGLNAMRALHRHSRGAP